MTTAVLVPTCALSILEALDNEEIFRASLPPDYSAWRSFLLSADGLGDQMTQAELALYHQCSGRTDVPRTPFRDRYALVGRRGMKSFTSALLAAYRSAFFDYTNVLAPGEVGTYMIISPVRRQCDTILNFLRGIFSKSSVLSRMVIAERQDSFELQNHYGNPINIETHTASYRTTRGYAVIGATCEELCFWRSEDSAEPDKEVINAIKPAMGNTGGVLFGISSAFVREGVMYRAFEKHHGKRKSDCLYWVADTMTMNPRFSQSVIDDAIEEDALAARAEYLSAWRDHEEGFVTLEMVESCVVEGSEGWDYDPDHQYYGFVDSASGTGKDSFAVAVAHREPDGRIVLDAVDEEKPPFSPQEAAMEAAEAFRVYGIHKIQGDKYAAGFAIDAFRSARMELEQSAMDRSKIYQQFLYLLNSGRVVLPDDARLKKQLCGLQRKLQPGGKVVIDHRPGSHDDISNAAAGGDCIGC